MIQQAERAARAYEAAQRPMVLLKSAVYDVLLDADTRGLRNVNIGKTLARIFHERPERWLSSGAW